MNCLKADAGDCFWSSLLLRAKRWFPDLILD